MCQLLWIQIYFLMTTYILVHLFDHRVNTIFQKNMLHIYPVCCFFFSFKVELLNLLIHTKNIAIWTWLKFQNIVHSVEFLPWIWQIVTCNCHLFLMCTRQINPLAIPTMYTYNGNNIFANSTSCVPYLLSLIFAIPSTFFLSHLYNGYVGEMTITDTL